MKISKIKIRNMFGISEHEADGKSVELTGKNGVGKSSVIDAIRYALTNASDREYIIKNGETEGEIYIETNTGLSIDRKARAGMSDYKSVKANGSNISSPEAFLRTLFTPLQLSPMEFIAMDKKQQNAIILNLIKYEWNLDTIKGWFGEIVPNVNYDQNILAVLNDIQAENGYYFQKRQDVNREIRQKTAIVTDIGAALPYNYDGSKWETVELGSIYTKIEQIRKANDTIEKAKMLKDNHDSKVRGFDAEKEVKMAALDREMVAEEKRIDENLAALKEQIKALEDKKANLAATKEDKASVIQSEYSAAVAKYDAEMQSYAEYLDKEITSTEDLEAEAAEVEKMKGHINEWKRMCVTQKEIEALTEESALLTTKIEKARTLPGEILEQAEIPIEGLTVKDGTPLINGLPVSNLSEGEKLDLCVDISVNNSSGLQIILIDGVEKLSAENRQRLYEKCKEKGLQFISTRTTDDDELTVIEL